MLACTVDEGHHARGSERRLHARRPSGSAQGRPRGERRAAGLGRLHRQPVVEHHRPALSPTWSTARWSTSPRGTTTRWATRRAAWTCCGTSGPGEGAVEAHRYDVARDPARARRPARAGAGGLQLSDQGRRGHRQHPDPRRAADHQVPARPGRPRRAPVAPRPPEGRARSRSSRCSRWCASWRRCSARRSTFIADPLHRCVVTATKRLPRGGVAVVENTRFYPGRGEERPRAGAAVRRAWATST